MTDLVVKPFDFTPIQAHRGKFSPSALDVYNTCEMMWKWLYIDSIKRVSVKRHFEIGTYFHELCHHYYRMVRDGFPVGSDQLHAAMRSRINKDLESITENNIELFSTVIKMMNDYMLRQSPNIDHFTKVVKVEDKFELEVVTPKGHKIILQGIADLLYLDRRGRLVLRDHKTGQQNYYKNGVALLFQLLFYAAVFQRTLGQPIHAIEISYINSYHYKKDGRAKKDFTELFDRVPYVLTDGYLDNFWDEMLAVIDQMLTKRPRRTHAACGSCAYAPLCERELLGLDTSNLIKGNYERAERDYTIRPVWITKREETSINNTTSVLSNQGSVRFSL